MIPSVYDAKNPLCAFLNDLPVISGRLLMTMEAGADTQQSGDTAVSESEAQQISLAQVINQIPCKPKIKIQSPAYACHTSKMLGSLTETLHDCWVYRRP